MLTYCHAIENTDEDDPEYRNMIHNKINTINRDEDGMTPTLWAAFEGNLEALRLLVGRG